MKMRNISKTQLLVKMKAVLRKIAQVLKKIVRFGKKAILKLRCHILRVFRDNFRDNNYLPRAKRILIYNIFEGKEEKSLAIINYAQKKGITISPIKFRHSIATYNFDKKTKTIFKGINNITIGR